MIDNSKEIEKMFTQIQETKDLTTQQKIDISLGFVKDGYLLCDAQFKSIRKTIKAICILSWLTSLTFLIIIFRLMVQ